MLCHCAGGSCNRYSGVCSSGCRAGWSGQNCQIPAICRIGYYGSWCTEKCHCLNDEPCDKQTGECPQRRCAAGYVVRSGQYTNCQECLRGFFGLDCLQPCHCAAHACDRVDGSCKGHCFDNWIEPDCRFGISRLVHIRVNPYQPSSFTCYVEATAPPDTTLVRLYRIINGTEGNSKSYNTSGISVTSSSISRSERAVVFAVEILYPDDEYACILLIGDGVQLSVKNPTFALPVIPEEPLILSTTSSTIHLQWNAWSAGNDTGNDPLVGYAIFMKTADKTNDWTIAKIVDEHTTSGIVRGLDPDTDYVISVAAVREGPGGTGPRSPNATARTLQRTLTWHGLRKESVGPVVGMIIFLVVIFHLILAFLLFRRRKQRRLTRGAKISPHEKSRRPLPGLPKHEEPIFEDLRITHSYKSSPKYVKEPIFDDLRITESCKSSPQHDEPIFDDLRVTESRKSSPKYVNEPIFDDLRITESSKSSPQNDEPIFDDLRITESCNPSPQHDEPIFSVLRLTQSSKSSMEHDEPIFDDLKITESSKSSPQHDEPIFGDLRLTQSSKSSLEHDEPMFDDLRLTQSCKSSPQHEKPMYDNHRLTESCKSSPQHNEPIFEDFNVDTGSNTDEEFDRDPESHTIVYEVSDCEFDPTPALYEEYDRDLDPDMTTYEEYDRDPEPDTTTYQECDRDHDPDTTAYEEYDRDPESNTTAYVPDPDEYENEYEEYDADCDMHHSDTVGY